MNSRTGIDDCEELRALKNGNIAAFTAIYEAYHSNLYLYAFKLLEDPDEAADVVQEVFVFLWEKREHLQLRGRLLPYLYQCVRNRFLNLADHRKVKEKFVDYIQHAGVRAVDTTSRELEEQELIDYLDRVTARFSSRMGEVFSLKRQGFQNEEIAQRLNVSVKTVKNLSSESIKRLRFKLGRITWLFILLASNIF